MLRGSSAVARAQALLSHSTALRPELLGTSAVVWDGVGAGSWCSTARGKETSPGLFCFLHPSTPNRTSKVQVIHWGWQRQGEGIGRRSSLPHLTSSLCLQELKTKSCTKPLLTTENFLLRAEANPEYHPHLPAPWVGLRTAGAPQPTKNPCRRWSHLLRRGSSGQGSQMNQHHLLQPGPRTPGHS